MLDFGDNEDQMPPKHKEPRKELSKEELNKLREAKELKKKQAQVEKAEKKYKEKKESQEAPEKLNVKFEELPRKMQIKIEKRKRKREELKLQRKLKIDFGQTDDKIYEKYSLAFPEMPEDKIRMQIKYQKLIHDAVHKQHRKKQS